MIGRYRANLLDIVFPRTCPVCSRSFETGGKWLCPACARQFEIERSGAACPTCGGIAASHEISNGGCAECRRKPSRLSGTVRVGPYGPLLGRLIRLYKYNGRDELEPILREALIDTVRGAPWIDRVEAVVPVPTHWIHRFTRPLYAAEILASALADRTGLPYLPILRRVRAGRHQVGLTYTRRVWNVRGLFAVRRGITLHKARLLLVDDVKTTGATIEECAKILRRGGAAEVYAAVVVKADWIAAAGSAISSV